MAYQSECHMVKQEHSIFLIQGHLHRRMLFILCNKILKSQKFLKSEKIMSMFDKWVYVYLVNSRVSNKRPSSPACFFFSKNFPTTPLLLGSPRLLSFLLCESNSLAICWKNTCLKFLPNVPALPPSTYIILYFNSALFSALWSYDLMNSKVCVQIINFLAWNGKTKLFRLVTVKTRPSKNE